MLITSGVAPDLDYASYLGGAGAFLRFHRTLFHSIAGAFVLACVIAGAFCVLDRKWKPGVPQNTQTQLQPLGFASALALCAIGAACHVLLDLASGEGVQLLWPFRVHWTAWDLAANFDPWVLIILIAGLLIPGLFALVGEEIGAPKKKASGSGAAVLTLLLMAVYFGARSELHGRAVALLLSSEYHGREPLKAGAFPSAANPFAWRGVVSTDNTIEEIDVALNAGSDFTRQRVSRHQFHRAPKIARNHLRPFFEPPVVLQLRSHLQMAASGKIAVDLLFSNDPFDTINRLHRRLVHLRCEIAAHLRAQLHNAQLQTREHHSAVARTGSPPRRFRLQHHHPRASPRQLACRGQPGVTRADNRNIRALRHGRGRFLRFDPRRVPPIRFFAKAHLCSRLFPNPPSKTAADGITTIAQLRCSRRPASNL